MKTIEQMLRALARTDVSEFAMASGRLPCVKVGGAFTPVDDAAPTSDQIIEMLVAVGGSRYVDALGAKPTQWMIRLEGVGSIAVAAVMRDDKVQARFVIAKREDAAPGSSRQGAPPDVTKTPSTVGRTAPPLQAPRTKLVATKTPSTAGGANHPGAVAPSKTPSTVAPAKRPSRAPPGNVAPSRTPSTAAASPGRGRVIAEEEPTAARGKVVAPGVDPMMVPTPMAIDLAGAMRMVDLDAEEAPTRPAGGGLIELDLERAMAAATVGNDCPQTTARDIELTGPASSDPRVEPDDGGDAPSLDRDRASTGPGPSADGEKTLDDMLGAAREAGASDLHIVAGRPLLFRIAGELLPRGQKIPPEAVERAVLARVPVRCQETLEKDGSCDFALDHARHGRFRVNVTRQRTGLKACLRLIPKEIPSLASLGLPEEIAKATHHHQGLIVLTGPTGHGKTSTLAAVVDIINRETTHHVITVEDPIEYVHPRKKAMMSQREVGTHTLSFQNALKAALREDPDVIVVGELRDTETVRMALSASETGHLVLGTMNTPSAAKTIDRLIDLFLLSDQSQVRMTLAGGLRLIVSQRLVPTVDGKSMVAAAELLPGSIPLWSLIRDSKTFQIPSLQQRGKGFGIIRIDDSLADLVRAEKMTKEVALSVAENPDELDAVLSGKRPPIAAPEAPKPASPDGKGGLFQKAGSLFGGGKKGA